MKPLPLLLLVFLLASVECLSQNEKPTTQTKEQIKLQQQLVKDAEKQQKREEKERLKRPASIQIRGNADEVGAWIVQHMNSVNYQIAEEGKYRIVFTQEVTGFRGAFIGAMAGTQGPPLRVLSFTISQLGDTTTVAVDLSVHMRKAFGRIDRADMNKQKEWRADAERLLTGLKYAVETQRRVIETKPLNPPFGAFQGALGLTLAGFEALKEGMEYPGVVEVLGVEGIVIENPASASGDPSMTTYQWKVPKDSGFAILVVMFKDRKLLHKMQSGLN